MLDETTKGVFTIAATPFTPDGAVTFRWVWEPSAMAEIVGDTASTSPTGSGIHAVLLSCTAGEVDTSVRKPALFPPRSVHHNFVNINHYCICAFPYCSLG